MNALQRALGLAPTNPFRKVNLIVLAIVVTALVLLGASVATGASGLTIDLFEILTGAFAVVLLVILLYGRGYARDIDKILGGEYVQKWTYTSDEWALFAREEASLQVGDAYITLGAGIVSAVGGYKLLVSTEGSPAVAAVSACAGLVIMALVALGIYLSSKTIASDAMSRNRVIYISRLGVLKPWGYMPIAGFNLRLAGATINMWTQPPELVLTSVYQTLYGPQQREVRVPVPGGHENEVKTPLSKLA